MRLCRGVSSRAIAPRRCAPAAASHRVLGWAGAARGGRSRHAPMGTLAVAPRRKPVPRRPVASTRGLPALQGRLGGLVYSLRPGEAARGRRFLVLVAAPTLSFWRRSAGAEPVDEALGRLRPHPIGHVLLAGADNRPQRGGNG